MNYKCCLNKKLTRQRVPDRDGPKKVAARREASQLSTDGNSKNVECSSVALCPASKTDAEQAECKAQQNRPEKWQGMERKGKLKAKG